MHDIQTSAETFRGIVCHVCLALLLSLIAVTLITWSAKAVAAPLRRLLSGGIVRIALAAAMVGTGVVESFSKHTNDPPRSVASPLPSVTPEDISNGWRVTETHEGNVLSRPQDGAYTIHEPWLVRGGFGDKAHLPTGDWLFPWRDGFADSLIVFSDGEARPDLRASYFPRPFDVPLAVVPAFNWHLLPGSVSNVFWHASTPSNTLVVAWENAPVNSDMNSLTNFQAEFFADGRLEYRYGDRTVGYAPVFPFDWDNDGLENSVDPEPLVAGPDAHGTNAEWYNTVCSNVLAAVAASCDPPIESSWREGVNSNAYYFVDVVAERGPAPIWFTGDRTSRLGDPIVVARAGETNRVPLLIGIDYAVTSPVPFSVSLPDEGFATVTTNSVSNYAMRWPLEFTVAPDGTGYRVSVGPYDPGCEFQWELPTRSSTCSYTTDGGWIEFGCCGAGNCGCNGCSVTGEAMLEDVSFDLPAVWCGCWRYDPPGPGVGPLVTNTPSVAVSFDKAVVFYEDAYTNAPNDVVSKHSTSTTLTVFAYGGESGGMLYVAERNVGKLVRIGGNAITFPYTAFIPPNSGVSLSIEYEAETYSDSEGDITVMASLMPGSSGETLSDSASTTVVKVLLEAQIPAVFGNNRSRHRYGIGEVILCQHEPSSIDVTWHASYGEVERKNGALWNFIAPLVAAECGLAIQVGNGERYFPSMSLVEPVGFSCERAEIIAFALGENVAGGAGMSLELYITPSNVCFGNIAMEEVPTGMGLVGGYFENEEFSAMWAHTRERRAGQWKNVGNDNLFMLGDEATLGDELPPMTPDGVLTNDVAFGWQHGAIVWTIPLGWNEHGTSGETAPIKTNAVPELQEFVITPDGTLTIAKAGHCVSRGTNTQTRIWRDVR